MLGGKQNGESEDRWQLPLRSLTAGLPLFLAGALALLQSTGCSQGPDYEQIHIVGSSTIYPFSAYVAEEFGKSTDFPTPVVESTGSGGGHKLFAQGTGKGTPDLTNSSRRIKPSEFELAQENGVGEITEALIGYDGIAIAQHVDNEPIALELEHLLLAVADEVPQDGKLVKNPYKFWNEIDPELPDREILIYGPPTTSGTRDAFEELAMEVPSEEMPEYGGPYTKIRQDGVFVPSQENDNLIVQRLARDQTALGILGYGFLAENRDKIQAATVGGVTPEPEKISSGEYPLSRSLYFYVKNAHVGEVPGIKEFVELFMSDKMIGPQGRLKRIGLIPLSDDLRKKSRERVLSFTPLELVDGELTSIDDYQPEAN